MTFVGKLLVVVNLALTLCIAMFAAGVHSVQTSWRQKHDAVQQQLEEVQANNEKQVNRFKELIAEAEEQRKTAEAERTEWKNKYDAEKRSFEEVKAGQDSLTNALASARKKNTILDTQKKGLEQRTKALEKALAEIHSRQDQLVERIARLMDERHELQRQKQQIQRTHARLVQQFLAARKRLAANDIDFDPERALTLALRPKPAEGIVEDVVPGTREKSTLVEISVGKDDGVTIGQSLFVYRLAEDDPRFLGRIEIVFVTADKAVGTLIDDPKNGDIRKGDYVSEKL